MKTRIKQYSSIVLPALLHSSENWNIKARDAERITAAEMKYMRKTAGYTWTDYKPNTQIAKNKQKSSLGQNTTIREKLFAKYKQNAPQ